jgi:phospholipase/carboxylesterase
METNLLPCVEVEPSGEVRAVVVWLHGLGADGHDFEPIVPHLGLPDNAGVRFVFPHAPSIPVTINMGMVMPAWYDITAMDLRKRHDVNGVRNSARQVEALLRREIERGIDSTRIVLAGFSMGGAIALHLGLRYSGKLAGIMALSTYLVCEETLKDEIEAAGAVNGSTPLFQAHGLHDPMVPQERGLAARERLESLGMEVQWKSYPMQHEVCPEEIRDIGSWLTRILSLESC